MNKPVRKKPRKRKTRYIDPVLEEERAKRIAVIQAKRQKIIDEVNLSLRRRRLDKIAIQNAHLQKEERARQKEIRDSRKTGSDKTMLQVLITSLL